MFLLFSTDLKFGKTSPSVYNANRIRPRWPPWPHLTCCPALGVNPGWKIGYQSFIFQPFAAFLALCSLSSFHRPKRQQDQPHQALPVQRRADPAENWSWDRTPPPSRPENGHLSKALLIKTASKPPTPWRWCVYWNTISQKCHCFQVLKNLIN